MKIRTHYDIAAPAIDVLIEAWKSDPKGFPFNKERAVVPQRLIPEWLMKDKFRLSCFLFFVCLYMKGRITSEQAFKKMLKVLKERPEMFEPHIVQFYSKEEVEGVLEKYINRDIVQTAKAWRENAKRLVTAWKGDPRNITKGLRSYKESLRRIKNKRKKGELRAALAASGPGGEGFEGFQNKMVAMLIYFFDWGGILTHRFIYPAPADFHNLRFAFAVGAMSLHPQPYATPYTTKLAAEWGKLVMRYIRDRGHDPIDVADVLWLFSLAACGESPLTEMIEERVEKVEERHLFKNGRVRDGLVLIKPDFMSRKLSFAERLSRTCLACPFLKQCKFTIPASPYYQSKKGPDRNRRGGQIYFIERPPIEKRYGMGKEVDVISDDEQGSFEF